MVYGKFKKPCTISFQENGTNLLKTTWVTGLKYSSYTGVAKSKESKKIKPKKTTIKPKNYPGWFRRILNGLTSN